MTRILIASALTATTLVAPVLATPRVLALDVAATSISFVLDATAHKVEGRLFLESGEIRFDLETGEAGGEIVIDAVRAETGNRRRDKTMHRKVLESASFPRFVFSPNWIEGELPERGDGELVLGGTLAIHGAEHEVTLPVRLRRDGDALSATAELVVPYVEWGLHRPGALFLRVAPDVLVRIEAVGKLSGPSDTP